MNCLHFYAGGMKLHFWYHSCLSFDFDQGLITIVVNDYTLTEKRKISALKNSAERLPRSLKRSLVVGRTYFTELKEHYQYLGKITNINLYKNMLKSDDMKVLTRDACKARGSFLAWSDMVWMKFGNPKV